MNCLLRENVWCEYVPIHLSVEAITEWTVGAVLCLHDSDLRLSSLQKMDVGMVVTEVRSDSFVKSEIPVRVSLF